VHEGKGDESEKGLCDHYSQSLPIATPP